MWADLPEDVFRELTDPVHIDRTHGKKSTSNKGCRGPLCRKAERETKEEQRRAKCAAEGREYKPNARSKGDVHRDEELHAILLWHLMLRTAPNPREEVLEGLAKRAAALSADNALCVS